ncbi:MAG: poly(A) polymerase [Nannocystaceae bacterium]
MPKPREKQGLRPVQDVVGRLRHDPTFDASRFVIGYDERFTGAREAPLTDFLAGSEIPWHRIQSIRAGSLVVWDRRSRVDLVFGSGESDAADHPAILRACAAPPPAPASTGRGRRRGKAGGGPAGTGRARAEPLALAPRTCWRFHPGRGAWEPAEPGPPVVAPSLHVATWNLLFDRHEADKIYSERRIVAALALLRERDADLIALQEVTPTALAALLREPWVRERYYMSSGTGSEGVDPYGVVLLSRWPLELAEHRFSPHKALLFGRLALAGRPLLCAVVHLTSNHKDDAADTRAEQLRALGRRLDEADVADALVLGDLNFGDADDDAIENQRVAACGLEDAWTRLHPHDPGFTFDPAQNPLAALMSRRGRAARFDRVLLRAPTGALAPIEITRFGDRPFARDGGEERYASDHFGVSALFELEAEVAPTIDAAPVHTSALVILPPSTPWPPVTAIQAIRALHDPSYVRWMPHINLIYGFVPEARFADAAAAIAVALGRRSTFTIRLGELRRFDHRGSTTLWIEPTTEPPGALRALQAALQAIFPICREQSERGAEGYTPHLTIAKLRGEPAEIAAIVERLRPHLPRGEWVVDAVHLIRRRDAEPFAVRHSLSLGTSSTEPLATPPAGAAWPSPAHQAVASAIAAACVDALGGPLRVHLVGSARLGVAAADGDLDLVCAHVDDEGDPLARVADALARRGPVALRAARGGGIRALRGELDGVDFDLLFARAPAELVLREAGLLGPEDLEGLDEGSRRALLGCVDADALVRIAGPAAAALRGALARVRAWTRGRALEGGAWGLLGGYTWAILVAYVAREAVLEVMSSGTASVAALELDPWALVRRFFARFSAWPAGEPVIPGPPPAPGSEARRAPWPIYTPTAPAFNSARGLTPSTHLLLRRELARGAAIVADADEAAALAPLCAPAGPDAPVELEIVVVAGDLADLSEATGAIDGRALGLLRDLEGAGAELRPRGWARAGSRARVRVGLRGGDPAAFARVVEGFLADLRAQGEWPPGAEVHASIAAAEAGSPGVVGP